MTLGDKVSHCLDFHVHVFSSKLHKMKCKRKQYDMFLITIAQMHKTDKRLTGRNTLNSKLVDFQRI